MLFLFRRNMSIKHLMLIDISIFDCHAVSHARLLRLLAPKIGLRRVSAMWGHLSGWTGYEPCTRNARFVHPVTQVVRYDFDIPLHSDNESRTLLSTAHLWAECRFEQLTSLVNSPIHEDMHQEDRPFYCISLGFQNRPFYFISLGFQFLHSMRTHDPYPVPIAPAEHRVDWDRDVVHVRHEVEHTG